MSIQRSLKPAYPPPWRTTRRAALCWPRLSPPARCPALSAARRRTGRSPWVTSNAPANALTTSSPATNFDSTAAPRSFVFGSNATMLNVDGRARVMPPETSGRYFAVSPFPQRLSSPRSSATPRMNVLLDLYGVLLDHEKMFRGYRERLAELLTARFGGDPDAWRRAHDEAWVTYVQRVNAAG